MNDPDTETLKNILGQSSGPLIAFQQPKLQNKNFGTLLKKQMRYSTKPNNNPKELINSMTKMKGHPIVSLRLTPDLNRMVFINANSTIVVFDFDTNKIIKVKLEV
jgi:hypothetical protein